MFAGVAQLVEQLICNQQVGGSSPSTSSKKTKHSTARLGVLFFQFFDGLEVGAVVNDSPVDCQSCE